MVWPFYSLVQAISGSALAELVLVLMGGTIHTYGGIPALTALLALAAEANLVSTACLMTTIPRGVFG